MRKSIGFACLALAMTVSAPAQSSQAPSAPSPTISSAAAAAPKSALEKMFEGNVKTEWEAFKNKDKKAYSDLLADDFMAIEDDTQGMRDKYHAVGEIERSVVANYNLFAFQVLPLNPNAALV